VTFSNPYGPVLLVGRVEFLLVADVVAIPFALTTISIISISIDDLSWILFVGNGDVFRFDESEESRKK
jgi:hypothetical protein